MKQIITICLFLIVVGPCYAEDEVKEKVSKNQNQKKLEKHWKLLKLYRAQNRTAEVRKEYENLLKIKPKDLDIRFLYGCFLYEHKRDKEAHAQFMKIAKEDPKSKYSKKIIEIYSVEIERNERKQILKKLKKELKLENFFDNENLQNHFSNLG